MRDSAEELECSAVPLLKSLCAFLGKYLAADCVGEGQRHHEERHLGGLPFQDNGDLAKVGLAFAWPMAQGNEDFRLALPPSPHGIFDDGVATVVTVLGAESIKDALRRVTLLSGSQTVLLSDLVNDRQEWRQLRLPPGLAPITRGLLMRQNLHQSPPAERILSAGLPLTNLSQQHSASNLDPFLHVLEHLILPSLMRLLMVLTNQLFLTIGRVGPRTPLFMIPRESPILEPSVSAAVHRWFGGIDYRSDHKAAGSSTCVFVVAEIRPINEFGAGTGS